MWVRSSSTCSRNGEATADRPPLPGSGVVPAGQTEPSTIIAGCGITASHRLRGVRWLQSHQHAALLEPGAHARPVRDPLPRLDRRTCAAGPGPRCTSAGPQERMDPTDLETSSGLRHHLHRWVSDQWSTNDRSLFDRSLFESNHRVSLVSVADAVFIVCVVYFPSDRTQLMKLNLCVGFASSHPTSPSLSHSPGVNVRVNGCQSLHVNVSSNPAGLSPPAFQTRPACHEWRCNRYMELDIRLLTISHGDWSVSVYVCTYKDRNEFVHSQQQSSHTPTDKRQQTPLSQKGNQLKPEG